MLCKDVFRLSTKAVDNYVDNLSLNRKKPLQNVGLSLGLKNCAENKIKKINNLVIMFGGIWTPAVSRVVKCFDVHKCLLKLRIYAD